MTFRSVIFVGLALLPSPAAADECYSDIISAVALDGKIIKTIGGKLFKVEDMYTVETMVWVPSEDIVYCRRSAYFQGQAYEFFQITNKRGRHPAFATLVP